MKTTRTHQSSLLKDSGVFSAYFFCFFFISSDQEFALHLDTSEGEEEESGSDDEAGVAGTPGKFTLIVFSVNQGCSVCYYKHVIEISKLYFVFFLCTIPPCAVPGPGPSQAATTAAPREYIFFHF